MAKDEEYEIWGWPKTNSIQASIQISIAVKPSACALNIGTKIQEKEMETKNSHLRRVGSDIIEDIDKNKKESDEKRHSAWK